MKPTIPLVLAGIAIGFAGGWLAKPDTSTTDTTAPENVRPSTRSESRATAKTEEKPRSSVRSSVTIVGGKEGQEMDPEMKKSIADAQKMQKEVMSKRLKKQYDLRITAMVQELGLNPEQEKALRAFYDQELDKLTSLDPSEMFSDPKEIRNLAASMRGDGLNNFMSDKLTAEQQEGLLAMQQRQHKNKVEARAMKTLAKLQQSLDLTEDQENQAYVILSEEAERQEEKQTDEDYIMRKYMETMGMGFGMGDDDLGSMFKMQEAAQNGGDSKAIFAQMQKDRKAEVDRKVKLMSPVLNEGQLKQYRGQLESQGGVFHMMFEEAGKK